MLEATTIAALLRELSLHYELEGDRARAFAYERASRAVAATRLLDRLVDEGRLEELPGVGASIARVVAELARHGTVPVLERHRAQWPPLVIELAQLPRVGVPKARKIFQAFAPESLEHVAALCRAGAIRELPGLGKGSEQKVLHAIEERLRAGARQVLAAAEAPAAALAQHLRGGAGIRRVEVCGPVRRGVELVDHYAYAVVAEQRDAVADRLASYALVTSVDRASREAADAEAPLLARHAGGLRVVVHVATAARLGWAMLAATSDPGHLEQLRGHAAERGAQVGRGAAPDEAAAYAALGLPYLPPEVRDGTDEVAAARAGERFDDLVTLADVTTAFHCHTTYSDGKQSIAEMAQRAAELGYGAIAITDHSAAATYASGLDLDRLREQAREVEELTPASRVLHGTEADILADGSIDVPAAVLGELDLVIASVHQRYELDAAGQTARLVAAMQQPMFKIWGHALGRLLGSREPIPVDLDRVLDALAGARGAIELNGSPLRLDLDAVAARRAAARGIRFVLSCDAHAIQELEWTRHAVTQARRARLRKRDVLNALPPEELVEAIRPLPR